MSTRREFLQTATALCGSAILSRAQALDSNPISQARLSADPRRPQFHLLPTHNWMNDPNGPVFFGNKYHMFFQYNPEAAIWGNMSWNHAVSTDMLHWRQEPVAFTMTPGSADAAGCFSGSMFVEEHAGKPRAYAIYTGVSKNKAKETVRNEGLREAQCLAWSDDPLLRQWQKEPQPVIPDPPPGLAVTGFRDPSMWKQDGSYFMTVGSGIEKEGGCVLLYRSSDMKQWEYLHPLASGRWSGVPASNPVADGEMWECPDFFRLDDGYVLIYSTMGKVFWQSGSLDSSMKFQVRKSGLLDLDAFYAPKTQLDAQGRRILWGWIPERRPNDALLEAGWAGMMSLPRLLRLDPDGILRMQILPTAETLRGKPLSTSSGAITLPAATGEVLCTGKQDADFFFTAGFGNEALMEVRYAAAEKAFSVNGQKLSLQPNDVPTVHAFVDGSVIEAVLGHRFAYTKRFYYPGSSAPAVKIGVQGNVQALNGWQITPISSDRLTTL